MIADYCAKRGAKKDSIEFLIMAGSRADAFKLAVDNEEMDEYAWVVLANDEKNFDEHQNIAQYYENKSKFIFQTWLKWSAELKLTLSHMN